MKGFPVGFRFHPKDTELVSYYLSNKAKLGDGFRSPYVCDCPDFYGKWEPWTLWDKYGGNSVEDGEPLFFFTRRKKLNPSGTRFDRKVGSGTWSGQYLVKVIEKGKVIGIKRDFRYEGGSSSDQNNAWLMTEYEQNKDDVTVLCTLRKSPTTPPPQTQTKESPQTETKKSVDENQGKRKLDDVVYNPEKDIDQRRKQQVKRPKTEETSCEEQGGSSSAIDHQRSSSNRTPYCEDFRPELVSDLTAVDDFVFSTCDFVASTTDEFKHVESSEFLNLFYENNNFDWLA